MIRRLFAVTLFAVSTQFSTQSASALDVRSLLDDVNPFSELPADQTRPEHAGLLGKMYLEARYNQIHTDEPVVQPYDDMYQGFDLTFNTPIPWLKELTEVVGSDVFFNFQEFSLGGSVMSTSLDMTVNSYQVGTSIYAAAFGPIRPFVQLGAQFDVITATGNNGSSTARFSSNESSFMVNVGVEADLSDNFAVRVMLNANDQRFSAPPLTTDLILWLHERFYIRGGAFVTTDGNDVGGLFGGGVVF
ncbi:hypothetical protein GC176_18640 [bacterium]|nr:hypothetical protein [bacterium]